MSIEDFDLGAEENGVLKGQLDADEVVNKLAMDLRCYSFNPSKNKYEKPDKTVKPYLNEEGISKIVAILKSRISNNNQYSNLSKDEIIAMRTNNNKNLWKMLVVNRDKYKIEIEQVGTILDMVDDALHLFLSRTDKGGFAGFIKGLFKGSESYSEAPQSKDKKRGIFG